MKLFLCTYPYIRDIMIDNVLHLWGVRYRASCELSCSDLCQTRERVGSVKRELQVGLKRELKVFMLQLTTYAFMCVVVKD